MPEQVQQELPCLHGANRLFEDLEVEVPPGHPGGYREGLAVEVVLQHRHFPPRSPGAATVGALAQSAFIDKDDGAAFRMGFFLMAGQRCFFHCWMALSSRSRARPTGCCGLQFIW